MRNGNVIERVPCEAWRQCRDIKGFEAPALEDALGIRIPGGYGGHQFCSIVRFVRGYGPYTSVPVIDKEQLVCIEIISQVNSVEVVELWTKDVSDLLFEVDEVKMRLAEYIAELEIERHARHNIPATPDKLALAIENGRSQPARFRVGMCGKTVKRADEPISWRDFVRLSDVKDPSWRGEFWVLAMSGLNPVRMEAKVLYRLVGYHVLSQDTVCDTRKQRYEHCRLED